MNAYKVTILGSNYSITTDVMAENEDLAFEQALYTLINSVPKIDLFDEELRYEAEFLEVVND
jgi:hypothetical protein